MTKGKIITLSVSVKLMEDTGKDLHTELTGLAHETMSALLATIPEAQSRSFGWTVKCERDHSNRRKHYRSSRATRHGFDPDNPPKDPTGDELQ